MKLNKVVLAIAIVGLVLAASTAFAGTKVAIDPKTATANVNGPVYSVDFEAFCNASPCNLTWQMIGSNSDVGSINNTSGPVTTFTAGTSPGHAIIIVKDDQGHMDSATVTVQQ